MIADAAERDRDLVAGFGADHVLPRGDRFTERVRELRPDGADGVVDVVPLHDRVLGAVRDGGAVATASAYFGESERGVRWPLVLVWDRVTDTAALTELRDMAEAGTLTLRVAEVFPAERAAQAQQLVMERGVRGRPVLRF